MWPSFLPDGRHFLILERTLGDDHASHWITIASLDSDQRRPLIETFSRAAYAPPGVLLYVRDGVLLAQRFDADELSLNGDPKPIVSGLLPPGMGHGGFWASNTGVLSLSSNGSFSVYRPALFDRAGTNLGPIAVPDSAQGCFDAMLSPDETRVALTCTDDETGIGDIYVAELARRLTSRLTRDPRWDQFGTWSPDGQRIVYIWESEELREHAADGRGSFRTLAYLQQVDAKPLDWSPDGNLVLSQTHERGFDSDLMLASADDPAEPVPFLDERFSEIDGRFSPGGRWVAYASDESGRFEIYVASFPDSETRHRISRDGGRRPHWRGDGRELFYIAADDRLVALPIQMTPTFELGEPEMLFETEFPLIYESRYSVTADGQRFLLYSRTQRPEMTVMLNWTAALEP